MGAREMRLLDLREQYDAELLDRFVLLYNQTFTNPTEREDPGQWRERLQNDLPPPQPRSHLLLAGPGDGATIADICGGLVFEHYRTSRCSLLTYIVVRPECRQRGIAGRLMARAVEILRDDAQNEGRPLRGVFAETEDPAQVSEDDSAMPPLQRLRVLARLGARRVNIPYVQPQLQGGNGRCRRLLLLALAPDGEPSLRLEGAIVRDFLFEFYQALGVAEPGADADFEMMSRSLGPFVSLKYLNEGGIP